MPATDPSTPNLLVILSDEWRAQAFGHAGDPNARTPAIDALAAESWHCTNAVANCPVCCPMRATLLTGLLPHRHGVFTNDVHLDQRFPSIADPFNLAGYRTAWIGKWHVDGHGRKAYIPPERRLRFHHFEALECEHDYWDSRYYRDDDPEQQSYPGYDADGQTASACAFMGADDAAPFACFLSWGPPHFPYHTAPEEDRAAFDPARLELRPNVAAEAEEEARRDLAGYYAHGRALDRCTGRLLAFLDEHGLADDTLVVFVSDHGDLLGCHGRIHKQWPYDESTGVPLLIRPPRAWNSRPRRIDASIGLLDLHPTLLGLCGVAPNRCAQGRDLSRALREGTELADQPQLISAYACFGSFERRHGGRVYRGLRDAGWLYVRDQGGPWLLFDRRADPYQQRNLVDDPAYVDIRARYESLLQAELARVGDGFASEEELHRRWGWPVNENGTVPFGRDRGVGACRYGCPGLGIPGPPP